jgi:hypothetical protein
VLTSPLGFSILLLLSTAVVFLVGCWLPSIRLGFFIRKKDEDVLWSNGTQMRNVPGKMVFTRYESEDSNSDYTHYRFQFRPLKWWHRLKESKGRLATATYLPDSGPHLAYPPPISHDDKLYKMLCSAANALLAEKKITGQWPNVKTFDSSAIHVVIDLAQLERISIPLRRRTV